MTAELSADGQPAYFSDMARISPRNEFRRPARRVQASSQEWGHIPVVGRRGESTSARRRRSNRSGSRPRSLVRRGEVCVFGVTSFSSIGAEGDRHIFQARERPEKGFVNRIHG